MTGFLHWQWWELSELPSHDEALRACSSCFQDDDDEDDDDDDDDDDKEVLQTLCGLLKFVLLSRAEETW